MASESISHLYLGPPFQSALWLTMSSSVAVTTAIPAVDFAWERQEHRLQ